MRFDKGHSKQGGRQSGTPNRTTSDLKTRISALLDTQFDTVVEDLNALEPKDRVMAYLKFLEYVLPKQREQRIDLPAISPFPYIDPSTLTDEQLKALIEN